MNEHSPDERPEPLYLLDIHHSGYLGWGVWRGQDKPELWTAETVERLYRHEHYKMGLNLGGQTYEWYPHFAARIKQWLAEFPDRLSVTVPSPVSVKRGLGHGTPFRKAPSSPA